MRWQTIICIWFSCCLLPFSSQAEDNSSTNSSLYELPPNHPGYGKNYAEKDFDYWRWLSDEEWERDPDNAHFVYDLKRGVFRHQELAAGVKIENLGKIYNGPRSSRNNSMNTQVKVKRSLFSMKTEQGDFNFVFFLAVLCGLIFLVVFVIAYRRRRRFSG